MDIIHGLSNLVSICTVSSSQQVEKEEEVKRNWVDLPHNVMSLIFMKLGTIDILVSAQWVCSSWWKLSKQPHLFRSIHMGQVITLFSRSVWLDLSLKISRGMAREAIDRSCRKLVEFSIRAGIHTDALLHYMSKKSSSLRCLRLVNYDGFVTDIGLIEIAKKLPQLEELEISHSSISKYVIGTFGRFCPRLKSCRLQYATYYLTKSEFNGVALAIAKNMPELRHLNLFGDKVTDKALRAILDGCPHLESLDLRQCFDLNLAGDLKKRCRNIKVLKLSNDPIDDFEYDLSNYDSDKPNSYYGGYYDDENYRF